MYFKLEFLFRMLALPNDLELRKECIKICHSCTDVNELLDEIYTS
jgi:hypothetical protein